MRFYPKEEKPVIGCPKKPEYIIRQLTVITRTKYADMRLILY